MARSPDGLKQEVRLSRAAWVPTKNRRDDEDEDVVHSDVGRAADVSHRRQRQEKQEKQKT